MTVVGPRGAGQVEVTTFRQDVSYSDGRHPDKITFSSPQEDAERRDFTINGMFFDPLEKRVVDFVGGQADVQRGIVRAIGNAHERFTEDKLRMLRAIRFASIFNFELEENTLAAIREMANQITVVSAERIAGEMRIMLVHPSRDRALRWLDSTGVLQHVLPEAAAIAAVDAAWERTLSLMNALDSPTFSLALAALLFEVSSTELADVVGRRWKLSRAEIDRLDWLLAQRTSLADARGAPWSQIQPLIVHDGAEELIQLHAAQAAIGLPVDAADVGFAQQQRELPVEELDPLPLVDGAVLIGLKIPRGPIFARLLKTVRAAQLDGRVTDRAAALALVKKLWADESKQ
jgi:tRNA nucleotidyltransferase/poly(A) polymerase